MPSLVPGGLGLLDDERVVFCYHAGRCSGLACMTLKNGILFGFDQALALVPVYGLHSTDYDDDGLAFQRYSGSVHDAWFAVGQPDHPFADGQYMMNIPLFPPLSLTP